MSYFSGAVWPLFLFVSFSISCRDVSAGFILLVSASSSYRAVSARPSSRLRTGLLFLHLWHLAWAWLSLCARVASCRWCQRHDAVFRCPCDWDSITIGSGFVRNQSSLSFFDRAVFCPFSIDPFIDCLRSMHCLSIPNSTLSSWTSMTISAMSPSISNPWAPSPPVLHLLSPSLCSHHRHRNPHPPLQAIPIPPCNPRRSTTS